MTEQMADDHALVTTTGEDPLFLGVFIGEVCTHGYLISKGVRNVAMCHTWGITHELAYDYIAKYLLGLNHSPGSRAVNFATISVPDPNGNIHREMVLWAPAVVDHEAVERFKASIISESRDREYHKKIGTALGYDVGLIEEFLNG